MSFKFRARTPTGRSSFPGTDSFLPHFFVTSARSYSVFTYEKGFTFFLIPK